MKQQTPNKRRSGPEQRPTPNVESRGAFTLIELLVVISIIIVLMGLLFPAFRGVQDQAKKTQAKNDITQIVTAVNAYYTEYGSIHSQRKAPTPLSRTTIAMSQIRCRLLPQEQTRRMR